LVRKLAVGLTPDDLVARRKFIGGSDANRIAGGDPGELQQLWQEKTGRSRPADLSAVLPVWMGSWTEELNRYWFEMQTGLDVTREGERLMHASYPYIAATLDGYTTTRDGQGCVFEAKHVNGFNYDAERILLRYLPQLHHQMFVAGVERAALSTFIGTQRWELQWIDFDPLYHAELLAREIGFWQCVAEDRSPTEERSIAPPDITPKVIAVDMTGNNLWAASAADYLENLDAAAKHKQAGDDLKGLLPDEAKSAYGHGVTVKRDARGAVRLSVERKR
jgi:predicted phage-related endonuclease